MKKFVKPIITLLLVAALLIPTVAMLYSSAATSFKVELAFENLFVFDHWVTNGNSMRVTNDAIANGSVAAYDVGSVININLDNGSFRLTNKTTGNVYTVAPMGQGEYTKDNFDYYRMPVEEGATYDFSYNITGNVPGFFPYVFFYDESNEFKQAINGAANSLGDNTYRFTVPEGIKYIQIRLTLAGNSDKNAYADIKNIAIYKVEYVPAQITELFDYNAWYNTNSKTANAYTQGTLTTNPDMQSLTLTSNAKGTASNAAIFTGLSLGSTSGFYTINVNPGKTYRVTYNISDQNLTQVSDIHSFIVWSNASTNSVVTVNGLPYLDTSATKDGKNTYEFIVPDNVSQIQVVFGLYEWNNVANKHVTVSDISLYEVLADSIIEHKVDPVRKTYTYNSENNGTYGALPNPPAATYPEGYVFAGWYTEKDGKGIRIASDTPILPQSYTVYPKFEPEVDNLTVATPPTKTEYTKGEKLNTAGLVLRATVGGQTIDVPSGYYITPEYASSTAGTQTITVHYGGKTTNFNVNVSNGNNKNIVANGNTHAVTVANNEYTINFHPSAPFNRYEMTYFSDSYVKGEIVMDGITEVFFLEPSDNGSFASYIDSFLAGINHYNVDSIKFTCLDKDFGNFELLSLTTIAAPVPSNPTQYYENSETGYKVGIDLRFGGVVSEIYDLENMTAADPVVVRVYKENGKNITRVDHRSILNRDFGTNYEAESTSVNLINTNDRGRYLQQSYYGTSQKPFEMGDYNGEPWPYNPVQGGNLQIKDKTTGQVIKGNESSKIIDYRITDDQIYIKTRPLDWGKNSVDYPDSYVTDSYMEAWYVFEDGMIKTYCRFVDYSGYPAHTRDQELPAVYIIEPLNNFVYNNVAAGSEWTTTNYAGKEEPDFWGVLPSYNDTLTANQKPTVDVDVECNENWAAFTASPDAGSFGVGVYSAGVTDFHYGCFPAIYSEDDAKVGKLTLRTDRHTASLDPAIESPTSYISPVGQMTFESYKPIEYSYYITTGTAKEIHDDFKTIALKDNQADADKSKIAVPETVYMTPANGASKTGQYYVNNIMDESLNNKVVTEAKRDAGMYLGLSIKDAKEFSVKITNVTNPSNDIFLCNSSGSEISEGSKIRFDSSGTYINDHDYGLRFSGAGLQPGEKATAKWEITVYFNDGSSKIFTAYTVMYAPHRTVGSVAEARQNQDSQNEISSWITGANGVDHSTRITLGSFKADVHDSGYFIQDPLIYGDTPPTISGSEGGNSHDYIVTSDPSELKDGGVNQTDDYSENAYVLQTATDDHDSSRAHSYLGLLTVDKSRYTNTNQIPNLRIGYDVLRIGSAKSNSVGKYATFYTLGTADAFVTEDLSKSPSGWTIFPSSGEYTDFADSHNIPYRDSLIPEFDVSTIDGKYIHALGKTRLDSIWADRQYSTAGTSVLCSVTDKSGLRDAVLNGYTIVDDDPDFNEALENAATVLGDPSATQPEIDEAKKELNDAMEELIEKFYALKYDNLFSAYEMSQFPASMKVVGDKGTATYKDGTITIVNGTITGGEAYTEYGSANHFYKVNLTPNTEYVFEYDVTTDAKAQAFMFFYNNRNENSEKPTNISVQTNGGAWQSKTEENSWWGNYTNSAGTYHYVIKFTTGATTTQASFRFGNTSNDPVTSTFSNIKLIDSARYYADVEYAKTEDVYKEYASYGALPTLTRPGYTFGGWVDAAGKTVTGADIATEHKSIFSKWNIINYTITYNANGGSVNPPSETYTVERTFNLPTPTHGGYIFSGWKVTTADGNWVNGTVHQANANVSGMYGNVTLTAQWTLSNFKAYFDTILDFSKWNTTTAGNATISNVKANGFTLTSNADAGEGTSSSPYFAVEPGKSYKIDIDITGNNWDVYIFFCNANGEWVDFQDSTNRYSSSGHGPADRIFTAPDKSEVVKAQIRVDANGASNSVTFSDIRVYKADTRAANVNVPWSSKDVTYDSTFGELPVPTREGYEFLGWYDGDTLITAESKVTQTSDVYLKSKWIITNDALVKDFVVIDFSNPIDITPLANDTVYATAKAAKFLGFSADGTTPGATTINGTYGKFAVNGQTVTYTPERTVNGTEKIYYHASITDENGTTDIKNEIIVAPASNVLYEETFFENSNAATSGTAWTEATVGGLSVSTTKQDPSPTADEKYGYDSNKAGYNKFSKYSNGTAKTVKVSANASNMMSKNITFTFTGTGFDLNSACGANTGVMVVSLKNNDTGAMVKSYVVDTYYGDAGYGDSTSSNTLYQVPIISESGLDYGNYTIQVVASYLPSMSGAIRADKAKEAEEQQKLQPGSVNGIDANVASGADNEALRNALAELGMEYIFDAAEVEVVWFDDNSVLNGGMGADTPIAGDTLETAALDGLVNVIDSVRIYNPLDDNYSYYIDSEKNVTYYNVIENLVKPNGGLGNTNNNFFAYVTGKLGDGIDLSISNYESVGPKDELYLAGSETATGVTFSIKGFVEGTKVMVSLRAASGNPVAKFGSYKLPAMSSNTEMYYDITDYVKGTNGVVTIQNETVGSLLAVGSIKIVSPVAVTASLSTEFDLMAARAMMMAEAVEVEPNTPVIPEEPEVPDNPEDPGVPEEPTDPEEPTSECWLVRFFKGVVDMFIKLIDILKGFFGW